MSAVPWLSLDDWQPPGIRALGDDHAMTRDLRAWTRGKPLTPGLPYVYAAEGEHEDGMLWIHYDDEHGSSWAVSARQQVSRRDAAVFGYGSLSTALTDCLKMARAYEAEDSVFLAVPGLA